jgi:translation elongation factor EF-Tu-like GTPase
VVEQRDSEQTTDHNCLRELLVCRRIMVVDLDMTVTLTFPEQIDKSHVVMPGDNCELVCELLHPIALDKGMRFTIRMSLYNTSNI